MIGDQELIVVFRKFIKCFFEDSNMDRKKKVLLMFSGGLDSRVSSKFLEELGFDVELFYVELPFDSIKKDIEGLEKIKEFARENNFPLRVVDVKKGKLFREYLDFIRNPKYGTGAAVNPCKDCKIFIFKIAKDYFENSRKKKFDILASGEVLGQRPMSQVKKALKFDDEKADLENKILRPLSALALSESVYEKKGLVDRNKLKGIVGRRREIQEKLAKKYNIDYPTAAGGCLLCDKNFGKKVNFLFDYYPKNKDIKFEHISLLKFGKMFISKGLIFSGRNESENKLLQKIGKKLVWGIYFNSKVPGPTVIYEKSSDKEIAEEIWKDYSEKNTEKIEELKGISI